MSVKTNSIQGPPSGFVKQAKMLYQYLDDSTCPDISLPNNKKVLTGQHVDIYNQKDTSTNKTKLLKKGATATSYHSYPLENIAEDGYTRLNITEDADELFSLDNTPLSTDPNTWPNPASWTGYEKYKLIDGETLPKYVNLWGANLIRQYNRTATAMRNRAGGLGNWFSSNSGNDFIQVMIDAAAFNEQIKGNNLWEHPLYNNKGGSYGVVFGGEVGSQFNSPPDDKSGNMSTEFWYESKLYGRAVHYGAIGALEISNKKKEIYGHPSLLNLACIWQDAEKLDDDIYGNVEFKNNTGRVYALVKTIASPAYMRAATLWACCIGDGIYIFGDQPYRVSDNPNHCSVNHEQLLKETTATVVKNGISYPNRGVFYPAQYWGGFDEVYLALYMISQPAVKSILEAATPWERPNWKLGSNANFTANPSPIRSFDDLLSGTAYANNYAMFRLKRSADGSKALLLAWHPGAGIGEQIYSVQTDLAGNHTEIELVGGWCELALVNL